MRALPRDRILAKMIDLAVVFLAAIILPAVIGPLIGFAYSLWGDALHVGQFHSQSLGKKLFRLRVVQMEDPAKPITAKQSAIRNSPVGLATFFAIIPVWGWVILFLVGVPLMALEIYLMLRADAGYRLGDVMGDTQVVTDTRAGT